jgi:hypothetical protein
VALFAVRVLLQRIADDLSGAANDATKATDRLLWAVNAFGQSLAEVKRDMEPLAHDE